MQHDALDIALGTVRANGDHPDQVLGGVDGWRYTDAGNAGRLIADHGAHLRYVATWGEWLAYADGRWQRDPKGTITGHLAARIGTDLLARVSDADGKDERRRLVDWATRSESAHGIDSTLRVARTVPGVAVHHDALDADPWLLNVRNGTVDLRTGQMRPHDPTDLQMMQTATSYVNGAPAVRFREFLTTILPETDVREFVQRILGLALVGEQMEHIFPVCIGDGANGKSTLTNIISTVLGDYAIAISTDLLLMLKHDSHPTGRARLFRARFAHSGELPQGARLDEAQVKKLTGGDTIEARRMREDPWEFLPSHLLWLHANHRPRIVGTDGGIWRRVLLIPFETIVAEQDQDPHLAAGIIRDESEGVLAWLIEGLHDYLDHGLNPPDAVKVATSNYRNESDTVARFLTESGVRLDPALSVTAADLRTAHEEWFKAAGATGIETNHYARVTTFLTAHGAQAKRASSRGGRYWEGVGIIDEAPAQGQGVSGGVAPSVLPVDAHAWRETGDPDTPRHPPSETPGHSVADDFGVQGEFCPLTDQDPDDDGDDW